MRAVKRFFSQFHRYVLWLLLSVFFWAWIFFMVTDTVKAKKVTVYIDAPEVQSEALAAALEENKPEGIKLIKVHPFSYAAFNSLSPGSADIYIMSESVMLENAEALCPVGTFTVGDADGGPSSGGRLYGLPMNGAASSYIRFESGETYYICFNAGSKHIKDLNGEGDNAALEVAELILALP